MLPAKNRVFLSVALLGSLVVPSGANTPLSAEDLYLHSIQTSGHNVICDLGNGVVRIADALAFYDCDISAGTISKRKPTGFDDYIIKFADEQRASIVRDGKLLATCDRGGLSILDDATGDVIVKAFRLPWIYGLSYVSTEDGVGARRRIQRDVPTQDNEIAKSLICDVSFHSIDINERAGLAAGGTFKSVHVFQFREEKIVKKSFWIDEKISPATISDKEIKSRVKSGELGSGEFPVYWLSGDYTGSKDRCQRVVVSGSGEHVVGLFGTKMHVWSIKEESLLLTVDNCQDVCVAAGNDDIIAVDVRGSVWMRDVCGKNVKNVFSLKNDASDAAGPVARVFSSRSSDNVVFVSPGRVVVASVTRNGVQIIREIRSEVFEVPLSVCLSESQKELFVLWKRGEKTRLEIVRNLGRDPSRFPVQ